MQIEAIKASLPNFPDQVIESWLLPFAIERGWPPYLADGHTASKGWEYLLLMKPKAFWLACTWSLQSIDLSLSDLSPLSRQAISDLSKAILVQEQNPCSNIINSKERLSRALAYLRRHEQHAAPPILVELQGGYSVADGNHRLAAYFLLQVLRTKNGENQLPPLRYWVAEAEG